MKKNSFQHEIKTKSHGGGVNYINPQSQRRENQKQSFSSEKIGNANGEIRSALKILAARKNKKGLALEHEQALL